LSNWAICHGGLTVVIMAREIGVTVWIRGVCATVSIPANRGGKLKKTLVQAVAIGLFFGLAAVGGVAVPGAVGG